jgi:hypothetical protein
LLDDQQAVLPGGSVSASNLAGAILVTLGHPPRLSLQVNKSLDWNIMRSLASLILLTFIAITTSAQVQSPPPSPSPVPDNAVNAALFSDLDRLQSTASQANSDIARMHIDKWKADGGTKQQSQANASSLQRNLTSALPVLIASVRSAPQDLTAGFKLYRNLNALYDVLASFTEAAGAFGPKNDFDALAQQLDAIDSVRRDIGDRLEGLATQTQTEMNQLRAQVHTLQQQAAVPAEPPKKVVVDNADTGKKPVHKKKPVAGSTSQPNAGVSAPPPAAPTKSQ